MFTMLPKLFIGIACLHFIVLVEGYPQDEDDTDKVVSVWECFSKETKMDCYLEHGKSKNGSGEEHDAEGCEQDVEWEGRDPVEMTVQERRPPFTPHRDPKLQRRFLSLFTATTEDDEGDEEDAGRPLPDISDISKRISQRGFLSNFDPKHKEAVRMTQELFMKERDPSDLFWLARGLLHKSGINPKVWYDSLVKTYFERDDMTGLQIPGPLDAFPDHFIPGEAFQGRRGTKDCYLIDGSIGKDNGAENALWYFREDLMINAHHWYWHEMYPADLDGRKLKRDRRGELFYFLHRVMIARHNIERLCNGMEFTKSIRMDRGVVIKPGYNSHLHDQNSDRNWNVRPPNTPIHELGNARWPHILELEERLKTAAQTGFYVAKNKEKVRIPAYEGITIMTNMIESSDESVNRYYYGDGGYHSDGHRMIGQAPIINRDPALTIMEDLSVTMRDPAFFQWHGHVDDILQLHKATLKPYERTEGDFPLLWSGVSIDKIDIGQGKPKTEAGTPVLSTFFTNKKLVLNPGIGFHGIRRNGRRDFKVCVKHLDHEEFSYVIKVRKNECSVGKDKSRKMTVRIFIAPRFDLKGQRFKMEQQRQLFVHLDHFIINGDASSVILTRWSNQSTLTTPWAQTLANLIQGDNRKTPECGCGWPHHLLLPRGTKEGTTFDLFVMLTPADADAKPPPKSAGKCRAGSILCGIPDENYPDRNPMGYPFDRKVDPSVVFLDDFIRRVPNMATIQVIIKHRRKK